ERGITRTAWFGRRTDHSTGLRGQPVTPVRPPASCMFVGFVQPVFRIARHIAMPGGGFLRPITTTFFRWRIDDAGYMAGSPQDEAYGTTQNIAAGVSRMPGNDMVFA